MKRPLLLLALMTVSLAAQVDPYLEPRKPFPLMERPFDPIKAGIFKPESPLGPISQYAPACAPMGEITRWVGSKALFDTLEWVLDGNSPYFASLGWPGTMTSDGASRVWFVEGADATVRLATTGGIHTVAHPSWMASNGAGASLPDFVTAMAYDTRRRTLFLGLGSSGLRSLNGSAWTGWVEANGLQDGSIWAGGTASVGYVLGLASDAAQDRLFLLDGGAVRVLDLLPGNLRTLATSIMVPSPDGKSSLLLTPRLLAWNAWTDELMLASDRLVAAFSPTTGKARMLLGPGMPVEPKGTLKGMAVDACGRVILSEFDTGRILQVDPRAGQAVTRELGPFNPTSPDTEAKIDGPLALVPMYDGVVLADQNTHTLRLIR